ncbi:hypothetical protein C0991_012146, partial [Blastosporella zonata]
MTPSTLLLNPQQPPSPSTSHRQTAMFLSPPSVSHGGVGAEDMDMDEADPKRASQIVYHSGFINRLADVPGLYHHAPHSFAKGWKPFKLELKGSKLHFYKPPSDRGTAVKELFPTVFGVEEEDGDGEGDISMSGMGGEE